MHALRCSTLAEALLALAAVTSAYTGAPADGSAWPGPAGECGVLRGAAWLFGARFVRVSHRGGYEPASPASSFGVRCVKDDL